MVSALKLNTQSEQTTVLSRVELSDPLLNEASEIFELMGWQDIPVDLKRIIAVDLIGFRDELRGLYSTFDTGVQARRKSIFWWIELFRSGACSLSTAVSALSYDC